MTNAALYRTAPVVLSCSRQAIRSASLFTPPTAEDIAVRDALNSVHFTASGSTFSCGDFHR